jgi:hypothetical protein
MTDVEEDIWAGATDEELLQDYEAAMAKMAETPPVVPRPLPGGGGRKRDPLAFFEQLRDDNIYQKEIDFWKQRGVELDFRTTGCWSLFYDFKNLSAAWKKISNLYKTNQLSGVLELAKCNDTFLRRRTTSNNGCPILIFTGPVTEKAHVMQVGRVILDYMEYTRQTCSPLRYKPNVYFKRSKRNKLFAGGPNKYTLSYE